MTPINQPRSQASRWEAMCVSPTGAVARGGEGFTDTWLGGGLGDEHRPYSFLGFWGIGFFFFGLRVVAIFTTRLMPPLLVVSNSGDRINPHLRAMKCDHLERV